MGFPIKFNWVLQYDPEEHLEVGRVYSFEKGGNRVFPLNAKIDLISSSRTAIAKIKIRKYFNIEDVTSGEYEIVKIYTDPEKSVLTNYWIENE